MTENMKAFIEMAEKNEALKAELEALGKEYADVQEASQNTEEIEKKTIDIAARYGITLTADDFNVELSDDQLKNIAGGSNGICVCAWAGYGGNLGKTGEGWCACSGYGHGADGARDPNGVWCLCGIGGGGSTGPNG